MLAVIYQISNK